VRPALAFLVVGQAGWSTGLRRANTGALAYHMPYIVSLSSLDQTYAQLACGAAARHAVPSADCERTPADTAGEVRRLRLTCTVTIVVGLDLYTKTRRAKADD